MEKIYTQNEKKWNEKINRKFHDMDECGFSVLEDGIILPLRFARSSKSPTFINYGGVCDRDGNFVAGLRRTKYNVDYELYFSCFDKYEFDQGKLLYDGRDVVWGGVIIPHFGHMLMDSFARLWYYVKNPSDNIYVFGLHGIWKRPPKYVWDLLNLLGLEEKQILLVEQPTRFKSITVPDEAIFSASCYRNEWILPFDKIRSSIRPANIAKIYLTRTELEKKDIVGEEYFENYFLKKGYVIISPEKYTVEEQIAFMSGASEIACTDGTLAHLTLFCKDGVSLTTLQRNSELVDMQLMVDHAKKIRRIAIDVSNNFLPCDHAKGGTLIGPNRNWEQYLIENDSEYCDTTNVSNLEEYIRNWARIYSDPYAFEYIKNQDFFDVFTAIYEWACGCKINREQYPVPKEKVTYKSYLILENRYNESQQKCMEYQRRIQELESICNISENGIKINNHGSRK